MAIISPVLRSIEGGNFAHWCPACGRMHAFYVGTPTHAGDKWTFDGNLDKPSFSPSMNIITGPRPTVPVGRPDAGKIDVCHYFLKAGVIQYLGDCTHAMAGKNVDLPPIP